MYFPSEVKREHFILCANTLVLARGVSGDPSKVYKSFYSVKLVITCKATRRLLLWNYLFIYFSSVLYASAYWRRKMIFLRTNVVRKTETDTSFAFAVHIECVQGDVIKFSTLN